MKNLFIVLIIVLINSGLGTLLFAQQNKSKDSTITWNILPEGKLPANSKEFETWLVKIADLINAGIDKNLLKGNYLKKSAGNGDDPTFYEASVTWMSDSLSIQYVNLFDEQISLKIMLPCGKIITYRSMIRYSPMERLYSSIVLKEILKDRALLKKQRDDELNEQLK